YSPLLHANSVNSSLILLLNPWPVMPAPSDSPLWVGAPSSLCKRFVAPMDRAELLALADWAPDDVASFQF
ncbi:MAG TPA: hypothetical protein VKJ45_17850, partial [Blastocatellia bacterium]|nr:hypothetical protein [Blastocatellia bacterium]